MCQMIFDVLGFKVWAYIDPQADYHSLIYNNLYIIQEEVIA